MCVCDTNFSLRCFNGCLRRPRQVKIDIECIPPHHATRKRYSEDGSYVRAQRFRTSVVVSYELFLSQEDGDMTVMSYIARTDMLQRRAGRHDLWSS
jgi:hypothetical protein